jgi:BirA family biotin operon repressor/biotin-[acetyl-CoA-carboxylase] ligase
LLARGYEFILLDDVDSTNNYAKSLKEYPDGSMLVIRAKKQCWGRGRGDNTFFSDHDGGLWVSVVAPVSDMLSHFEHNRAMSLAIAESLRGIDKNAPVKIKWPNDIYWGGKKIAGILLENIQKNPNALIIGFGINVNIKQTDFPEDIRESATSVLIETGTVQPIDKLLEDILIGYIWHRDDDQEAVHKLYLDNMYKKGHPAVIDGYVGIAAAVEPDGRLRLEVSGGHSRWFSSGTLRFAKEP